MEELKESIKEAVKHRLTSPIFGFVALSFLVKNWDAILILALSKSSIEQRIAAILNEPSYYSQRFFQPILWGLILAIAYPYLQMGIDWLQTWAANHKLKKEIEAEGNILDKQILLSQKKADASVADEHSNMAAKAALALQAEINNTKIEREKEKQELARMGIDNAKDELDKLNNSKKNLEEQISQLQNEYNAQTAIISSVYVKSQKAVRILDYIISQHNDDETYESFLSLRELFTQQERDYLEKLEINGVNNGKSTSDIMEFNGKRLASLEYQLRKLIRTLDEIFDSGILIERKEVYKFLIGIIDENEFIRKYIGAKSTEGQQIFLSILPHIKIIKSMAPPGILSRYKNLFFDKEASEN
ncbi:hypothetical protein [Nissabacter sp. SGAir0207]|uniref:hypothetical protein n=1 Tax=Nissabacter sp. SGAir0207 TaxID=2126321 RepID=UPI0010CCD9FD|nr:hypothetical protein [Nissabacter sp. SGAir0207]QCR38743.1 hypothetical protein C1N62_21665 [Nissabacter sp. SGAir0207]